MTCDPHAGASADAAPLAPYSQDLVPVRLGDGIATITLSRAPANAFNRDMYDQLRHVFLEIARDPAVRAAILTGAGKLFCGGNEVGDFDGVTPQAAREYLTHIRQAYEAMHACPVPVVGVINGAAAGTGLILASLCDIRVVATHAVFLLPEINIGLAGGACHLLRLVGQGTARLMAYTGCRLDAAQAMRVGLADFVEPADAAMARGRTLARDIAGKSATAIRQIKRGLNAYDSMSLEEGFAFECGLIADTLQTPEAARAISAFLNNKRVSALP